MASKVNASLVKKLTSYVETITATGKKGMLAMSAGSTVAVELLISAALVYLKSTVKNEQSRQKLITTMTSFDRFVHITFPEIEL